MKCPYCGSEDTKVVDKRINDNNENRRRRECPNCSKRFTTYEKIEEIKREDIQHIKKRDGSIVLFNPKKIRDAIFKAAVSVGGKDIKLAEKLSQKVVEMLKLKYDNENIPSVEDIQDTVEKVLIEDGHAKTSKAYIIYREQRKKIRNMKSFFLDMDSTVSEYLHQDHWNIKENSNEAFSFSGLLLHTAGKVISNYALNGIYTPQIAKAHRLGYIHIHDLSNALIGYCCGHSLKNLLLWGFGGVPNKVDAKPAKHLRVVIHQMVNYIGCLQMEFAGAQAFSVSWDEPIVIKDSKNNINIVRIGEFCDKFINKNKNLHGCLEYSDIKNEEIYALSFNENGKYAWKRIKKTIRHKITDPLHVVKTNKGVLSVSKSHSVFSLDTHHYLGKKEGLLMNYIDEIEYLPSFELRNVGLGFGINSPEKIIQNFNRRELILSELKNFNNAPQRHYAIYRPKLQKKLVLNRIMDLNNFGKEIKTLDKNISNIASLSNFDLPQEEIINLFEIIKNDDNLEKIAWVSLNKKDIKEIKDAIKFEYGSLRKLSKDLGYCNGYIWRLLNIGKLPFKIYKNILKSKNIKFSRFRSKETINSILRGNKLKLFIKLCAWYLSEGWKVHKNSIGVSQKGKYVEEILNIVKELKLSYFIQNHPTGKIQIIMNGIIPSLIVNLCGQYSYNKEIPSFIYNLNNDLKNLFINELIKGDGYKKGKNSVYISTSNKLITGLNLIATSLGIRTSIKTRFIDNKIKEKGKKLKRFDIVLYNEKYPYVLKCNDFESAVVLENYEINTKDEYEYDVSVEDTETFVGGVGLFGLHNSSVDTLLSPFVKTDNLDYESVKQGMQELVYSLNIPSRWGSQYPFSNLTFDWVVPEEMRNEKAIVGGKQQNFTYNDCQKEMDMINKAFLEVMLEGDAHGRIFTFPIPTYNVTKDFDWDSENAKLLFDVTAKYGTPYFQNYVGSGLDPRSIHAMCCRLNINKLELMNRPGNMWGPGDSTGSVGVCTINVNRIAYESISKDDFFNRLEDYMNLSKSSLELKRKIIEKNLEAGLMPFTKRYLGTFDNHFSTIGLCGMNEACLNFLGKSIASEEGKEFAIETLNFMRKVLIKFQRETDNLYNLEATPAESTAYRFAKLDKEMYPDIIVSGEEEYYLTNSTQLPVDHTEDAIEAINHQNDIQHLYSGGTIFHTFLGERMSSGEACKQLVKKIAYNTKLPYFSITPTFSICKEHGYIKGEFFNCPKCNKETEVYSRIVGYYRPVQNWNAGKKEEFRFRKEFNEEKTLNSSVEIKNKPEIQQSVIQH